MRGSILIWLALGLGLRLILLLQPPVEDNSWIRQTQTADAIQSWMNAGRPSWDAGASWRGDTGARLAQELPLYNLLVYGGAWAGIPLNVAGRLTSALLWGAGFFLLQSIWGRWLDDRQRFWANFLYVFSPVSVALGQAVLPEMLVQLLALGFMVLLLRYLDQPSLAVWWGMVALGTTGALLKLPGFSHYFLLLGTVLFLKKGWLFGTQRRVWLGALVVLAAMFLWSRYTQRINGPLFPDWTPAANLQGFLGRWQERFQPVYWIRLAGYLFLFVGTPVAWLVLLGGLWKEGKNWLRLPLLAPWLAGLAVMVLLWGPRTCMGHVYYCLPFLIPVCGLFGKVAAGLSDRGKGLGLAAGILAGCLPMTIYLLRPDTTLRQTAEWMKKNIPADDLVILKANHSVYTREYPQLPGFSYLSGRRVWVWTPFLSPNEKRRALETGRWIVETLPPEKEVWWENVRKTIKGHQRPVEDISGLIQETGATVVYQTPKFRALSISPKP